ncbi:MAG TPA: hypothetical protein PKD05_02435 [Candidatus Melainabacteria bacterium]|nr:hypothetical protein [Candidatus Melainabacteria bacterium]
MFRFRINPLPNYKKPLNHPLHIVYAHPSRFFLYLGIMSLMFSASKTVNNLDFDVIESLVLMLGIISLFRIWLNCNCGVLLAGSDKRHAIRSILLVQTPTFFILLYSVASKQMSESPVPDMVCGLWFVFLSAMGVSILKTTQISELEGKSLEEISSVVNSQVLLNDFESADEASKILLREAEKLNHGDANCIQEE